VQHLDSNLSLANTSVAADRTSGFRVSVFRFYSVFPCLRLYVSAAGSYSGKVGLSSVVCLLYVQRGFL
jgi:hypothetical protein